MASLEELKAAMATACTCGCGGISIAANAVIAHLEARITELEDAMLCKDNGAMILANAIRFWPERLLESVARKMYPPLESRLSECQKREVQFYGFLKHALMCSSNANDCETCKKASGLVFNSTALEVKK